MNKYRLFAGAAALAVAMAATGGAAQSGDDLAAKFGAREGIRDIGISPEGKQVVIVAPRPDGGENAIVVSLANGAAVPILGANGTTEQIASCEFPIETHVVCRLYLRKGTGADVETGTRLVSLAADGSKMQQLTADMRSNAFYESNSGGDIIDYDVSDNPRAVLMTRYYAPERQTGALGASTAVGLGVEEVDLASLNRKRVELPRETAFWYATDGHGNVRLMGTQPTRESGYAKQNENFQYRAIGGNWTPLSSVVSSDVGLSTGFVPVAVDARENVAYGFESNGNFTALYKMALDGSGTKTLVLGRDDAEVNGLIEIGRNQRIVGASYDTDRRVAEYFDPELKQLVASLGRALGGGKSVDIIDSSTDESKLIVFAGSDTDPGAYYLYDKATKKLAMLFPARPELVGLPLGTMKTVQYPAADGTLIPAYLTLPPGSDGKNLPAIVMPHGGPQSRDEWGFDWISQYFVARGYAVLQPNYRGSAGLGEAWFQQNGWQGWETAIGDVNSAGKWLQDQGIAAPGKLAIFGWSYGGYAALQSQVLDPDLFKAVVAVAPVTDLDRLREESRNQSNYLIMDRFIGNGPHVAAGSPARHADVFHAPVLLFHGDGDVNVNVAESRLMESRLKDAGKQVTYIEFKNLDHQLYQQAARARLLSESDRFLRRTLGL
jgi:dipeptidyl aminopeptidase/acylaminoacyl peptidase